jgi:isoleucyl-tRNA synthetase
VLDLSSFYLDIIKDRLYVSPPGSIARRSAQTAMQEILDVMVRLMAPILSFTADEIWQYRNRSDKFSSVHTSQFIPVKEEYRDKALNERWEKIIRLRKEVTKALEIARKDKLIGHSLDATVTLDLPDEYKDFLVPYMNDLSAIFIVSSVKTGNPDGEGCYTSDDIQGLKVKVEPSSDIKCERCWVHDPTVGKYPDHPSICERCYDALKQMGVK